MLATVAKFVAVGVLAVILVGLIAVAAFALPLLLATLLG
ncbi:MAG: hypothetical protein K0S98_2719 [Propionibacteriaceae bacterium]|jgi:hypothetical protein|nr:hypothetical protein [Propionibacteriaceae bacterium]